MKVSKWVQLDWSSVLIAFLFLFVVLYALGYFYLKKINNVVFQEPVIFENTEEIERILKTVLADRESNTSGLSVVYFWKPYCPCNLGVGPHYSELVEEYTKKNVDFYIVDLSDSESSGYAPEGMLLPASAAKLLAPYIEYSPSIAILSSDNTLLYYGPHSLGFVCNAETSIASQVINSFRQGINSKNINVLGNGCFCRTL